MTIEYVNYHDDTDALPLDGYWYTTERTEYNDINNPWCGYSEQAFLDRYDAHSIPEAIAAAKAAGHEVCRQQVHRDDCPRQGRCLCDRRVIKC